MRAGSIRVDKKRRRGLPHSRGLHIDPVNDPWDVEAALRSRDGTACSYRYTCLVRRCRDRRSLDEGRRVHRHIRGNGFGGETFLGNLLVEMYAKCGSWDDARQAFEEIQQKNCFSFGAVIAAAADTSGFDELELERKLAVVVLFQRLLLEGLRPDGQILGCLVWSSLSKETARSAHGCVVESGLEQELGNSMVSSYLKCGGLDEARELFERLESKGLFAWTAIIGACAQRDRNQEAVELFHRMDLAGVKPDIVSFISNLRACTNLEDLSQGRGIHRRLSAEGLDKDVIVANALVNLYSKCGRLEEAMEVFRTSPKNEASWNTLINACSREERSGDALQLFREMLLDGTRPNDVTFVGVTGACSDDRQAKQVHDCVLASGLENYSTVGTAIVTMYGKSGNLAEASRVFERLHCKNTITWNTMFGAYTQHRRLEEALALHTRMELEGVKQNRVTFLGLLDVCSEMERLPAGEAVHARITETGYSGDPVLDSAVVHMYTRCKSLEQARSVFDRMHRKTEVTWTTLISAYAQQGQGMEALKLFRQMDLAGVKPDEVTYVNVLGACCSLGVRSEAESIRSRIVSTGLLGSSGLLKNNLVNTYGKLGDVAHARKAFEEMETRDVCSCTAMIAALVENGHEKEALELHRKMDLEGLKSDDVTYMSVLEACSRTDGVRTGRKIHDRIASTGSDADVYVATALISMYGKCGDLDSARALFEKLTTRTVVTWNTLITSYAQHGHNKDALRLYQRMEPDGVEPDEITFVAVVGACGEMQSLAEARPVHERIIAAGLETGALVSTAMISMYGKCGSLNDARKIFDTTSDLTNLVSWNAMIIAYAQNGDGLQGLALYEIMTLDGVEPNGVTYTGVLFACAHAGLLDDAWRQFVALKTDRGIEWEDEHLSCMTDMLGRLGRLDEAEEFLWRFPQAGGVPWLSLLNSCMLHGDLERAERVSKETMRRNPRTSSSYVMLSNIFAAAELGKRYRKLATRL